MFQKRKQQVSIMHYKYIKASEFPLPIIHPQAKSVKMPLKILQKTLVKTKELTSTSKASFQFPVKCCFKLTCKACQAYQSSFSFLSFFFFPLLLAFVEYNSPHKFLCSGIYGLQFVLADNAFRFSLCRNAVQQNFNSFQVETKT